MSAEPQIRSTGVRRLTSWRRSIVLGLAAMSPASGELVLSLALAEVTPCDWDAELRRLLDEG